MRLASLLESSGTDPGRTKAAPDVLESYKRARKLKSYKDLLSMGFKDVSGPMQLGRGVFQFEQEGSSRWPIYYVVFPHGTIRYNAGSTQTSTQKVPELTKRNFLEDYNRLITRVIDIQTAKAAGTKVPQPKHYEDEDKTHEFSKDEDTSFVIHDDLLTKLPSDQKIVVNYNLVNLPNLGTLEGGPKQITGKHAVLRNLGVLKNLKGFPKGERELEVSIIDCKHLTSLEGIECTKLVLKNLKKLTSLEGLGLKFGRDIESISFENVDIKSNIMGLAAMKNLKDIDFPGQRVVDLPDWAVQLLRVIRNYEPSDRLIELQHALLDAKLHDYAKP